LGIVGGIENLETVASAPEESSGELRAPGWVADVELYLLLVHSVCILSLLPQSQSRIAEEGARRIAQMRDLLVVQFA